jgi:hypothetical protein
MTLQRVNSPKTLPHSLDFVALELVISDGLEAQDFRSPGTRDGGAQREMLHTEPVRVVDGSDGRRSTRDFFGEGVVIPDPVASRVKSQAA